MKNEIGSVFGRLIVLRFAPSQGGKARWLCRCSCGNDKTVTGDSLRQGKVQSCGCYQQECRSATRKTHGMSRTPTYRSWQEMRVRCSDPTVISFSNYGGRGISVCARWHSFENFLTDMGVRPSESSLERNDNTKNYDPNNCRWATRTEQNRNKRSNRVLLYKGERRCLSEWCERLAIPYPRTYYRVFVKGWPVGDAFELPNKRKPS